MREWAVRESESSEEREGGEEKRGRRRVLSGVRECACEVMKRRRKKKE
jgi:hypothetical protein